MEGKPDERELRKIKLINDCRTSAFHEFGTGFIFEKRASKYRRLLKSLKIMGIIVPVSVGATASGYGFDSQVLKYMIIISVPVSIIQLVISVIAVASNWDEELDYSFESSRHHSELYAKYKKLADYPPSSLDDFERQRALIDTESQQRSNSDKKHPINEWENRLGMRYSLREYQKACAGCTETPVSMNSTNCDVCGNFDKSINYKFFYHE